jgi:putative transcriptional regulator
MAEFLESIMRGLQGPLTKPRRAPIRPVEVKVPDVPAIRARTGLSQVDFAKSIGVKRATLLNWEQKRRTPEGPARVLLALIDRDPGLVQRVLAPRQ